MRMPHRRRKLSRVDVRKDGHFYKSPHALDQTLNKRYSESSICHEVAKLALTLLNS